MSITRSGAVSAAIPVWLSRDRWIDGVSQWAGCPDFAAVCAKTGISITGSTVVAIARAWSGFADHATGRNTATTRATLAAEIGCAPRTITRAWTILANAGWAIEATRGHGSPTTHPYGRRPSIWHLTTPTPRTSHRLEPASPVGAVGNVHLPPKGGFSSLSPVDLYSPRVRAGGPAPTPTAPASTQKQKKPTPAAKAHPCSTPRPLALQRLAAQLVNICQGLDKPGKNHIGAICDALTTAGINPHIWTARHITSVLNTDMRENNRTWPDHIDNPAAFLATRLRHTTTTTPPPLNPAEYCTG